MERWRGRGRVGCDRRRIGREGAAWQLQGHGECGREELEEGRGRERGGRGRWWVSTKRGGGRVEVRRRRVGGVNGRREGGCAGGGKVKIVGVSWPNPSK